MTNQCTDHGLLAPTLEKIKEENPDKVIETVAEENHEGRCKGHFEKRKVVKFFFKPNRKKMSNKLCLSEHPFGTIKRAMGSTHFLLRGMEKVEGEFALFCLGYNIERAKNLLGFNKLMELMASV